MKGFLYINQAVGGKENPTVPIFMFRGAVFGGRAGADLSLSGFAENPHL